MSVESNIIYSVETSIAYSDLTSDIDSLGLQAHSRVLVLAIRDFSGLSLIVLICPLGYVKYVQITKL